MANFFKTFVSKVFPTVRAQEEEEDLVDQQAALKVSVL